MTETRTPHVLLLFPIGLSLFGLMLLYFGYREIRENRALIFGGAETIATITGYEVATEGRKHRYFTRYEFVQRDGRKVQAKDPAAHSEKPYEVGARVGVIYNVESAEANSAITTRWRLLKTPVQMALVTLVLFFFAVAMAGALIAPESVGVVRAIAGYAGGLMLIGAGGLGVSTVSDWKVLVSLSLNGTSAEGQVVTEEENFVNQTWENRALNQLPRIFYYPVVKFQTASGQSQLLTASVGRESRAYADGAKVTVRYLASAPEVSRIASFRELYMRPLIRSILAAGLLVVGLYMLMRALKLG